MAAALDAVAEHPDDRRGETGQIFGGYGEGGRQIDDPAEGTDPDACLHEAAAQAVKIGDAVELDHPDRALDSHIDDARKIPARRQIAGQRG